MYTKLLVSASIAVASIAGAAPTSADPSPSEPSGAHANPFSGLGCECPGSPHSTHPDSDFDRGIATALAGRADHPKS